MKFYIANAIKNNDIQIRKIGSTKDDKVTIKKNTKYVSSAGEKGQSIIQYDRDNKIWIFKTEYKNSERSWVLSRKSNQFICIPEQDSEIKQSGVITLKKDELIKIIKEYESLRDIEDGKKYDKTKEIFKNARKKHKYPIKVLDILVKELINDKQQNLKSKKKQEENER